MPTEMTNNNLEYALGKGLMQPFANTNSGTRKLMYSVHLEQSLQLINPENPIIQTGYEIRYGDLSSSIIKIDSDFEVIGKIYKFSARPNDHYLLIIRRKDDGMYDVIERKSYNHIGETYGYLYDNTILDELEVGFEVPSEQILRTSYANDKYMNRCDGANLTVGYISSDKDMEDGIVISEEAAQKLASPLIKEVTVFIGENDILLNLYGDEDNIKSFPNIGENVKDGILCAIRKERIEECLYVQANKRLRQPIMSDEKFTVEGTVIDIEVHSNNPLELQDRHTNKQLLYYYNDHIRYIKEIVELIDMIKERSGGNISMSHELQVIYWTAKYELDGMLFEENKKFDGTLFKIYILDKNVPTIGDKITNRYGGKGVISFIRPKDEMPLLDNGKRLDIYFNSCTCVNRLNQGQLNEMSLTFIGSRILEHIYDRTPNISCDEALDMIYRFINIVSPEEAKSFIHTLYNENVTEEDREWFLDECLDDGYILLSIKPITESMTLDKLALIYREFPFIEQYSSVSKILDSAGKPRYVKGRRKITAGSMYIYRLKQYAEDKFSATSLSSTNLTNENTKSKASKNYMAICPNTPIRFGEMETEDERHMGTQVVVENLMIHSTSPQARRLTESFIEGDPYTIDIKLDGTCKSRSAEKAKVYLKAMGYAIKFYKVPKKKKRLFEIATPVTLPGEKPKLFSYDHPDENHGTGEEWLDKLNLLQKARNKRLFRRKLLIPAGDKKDE